MIAMTVGRLKSLLNNFDDADEIFTSHREAGGVGITSINYIGHDPHGNIVITLDRELLERR